MVFIYCLSFFNDAGHSKHSWFVEILVERWIFECNIKKSVPRSLQIKKYYFQELKYVVEIWNCNSRYQRLVNDEQVIRVELKGFTRFVLKLVFRASGRIVPRDKAPTSKRTGLYNLHVTFKCCL